MINLIIPDLSLHLRSRTYRIIEHKDDEGTDQVWTAPPSASSAISKLATFKVMALAKAGVSTKEKGKQKDSSDRLEERRPLPSVE